MAPRAKGAYQVRQQRPRYDTTAEKKSILVPFVGPFEALKSKEPAIDSTLVGFPSEYKVAKVTLDEGQSSDGRMVVTLEKPQPGNNPSNDDTQLADPVYESDYSEERRPIEENKKCGKLKPDRPYYEFPDRKTSAANPKKTAAEANADTETAYKQRTWENWQSLDTDDFDPAASGWTLVEYKALKEKGRNDYPVAYPVCTATTYHKYPPSTGSGVQQINSPPSQCDPPAGYTYVKSGDRKTKQGRLYTRVQSWRGYDSTDELFFL